MNRSLLILIFYMILVPIIIGFARDVEVKDIYLSDIDEETAIINYTLIRTKPPIDENQPIWIFVKYRQATESDYLSWQDTDDLDYTNDDSDGRFEGNNGSENEVSKTVNKHLSGDVGIVESGGDKKILWSWGTAGTGLLSIDDVMVRVYPIEIVKVPGGEITFGSDFDNTWNSLTGGTAVIEDFYMTKYPCTTKMYAEFLNVCANRHDGLADDDRDFYYELDMNGNRYCRLHKISGSIENQDAVFAPVSGFENVAMTYVNWYNAYDFAKWAGLRMMTGEEFEYEATNKGTRYWPWGDDEPNSTDNIRANMKRVPPDNASDVRTYDGYGVRKSGLSIHGVAEMAGNVWKWCFTAWYQGDYDKSNSTEAKAGYALYPSQLYVMRGAAFLYESFRLRGAGRSLNHPSDRTNSLGFHLAKSISIRIKN